MFRIPNCVVCRQESDLKTCYHQINNGVRLSIAVCDKCFEETKDNWFYEPWKVMPETSEPSQDALKPPSSES